MKTNNVSKSIIVLCIMAWIVLAIGVCGSLDCNTMEVNEAIGFITVRTIILACIVGISAVSDLLYKNTRKENDKYGYVSTRNGRRSSINHRIFTCNDWSR